MKPLLTMRHPAHYIACAITGYIAQDFPIPASLLFAGFMIYEIKQDRDRKAGEIPKVPDSHLDICEFVVALTIGITARVFTKSFGMH